MATSFGADGEPLLAKPGKLLFEDDFSRSVIAPKWTVGKGAYLVEGGVVDTAAVVAALANGHLIGAGIDVLEQEPPPEDSVVLRAWRDPNHHAHDRLLLNPHTAFYCEQGSEEFRVKGSLEVLRALQGQPLRNRVN